MTEGKRKGLGVNLASVLVLDASCPVGPAVDAARLLTESAFVVVVDRGVMPVRYFTFQAGLVARIAGRAGADELLSEVLRLAELTPSGCSDVTADLGDWRRADPGSVVVRSGAVLGVTVSDGTTRSVTGWATAPLVVPRSGWGPAGVDPGVDHGGGLAQKNGGGSVQQNSGLGGDLGGHPGWLRPGAKAPPGHGTGPHEWEHIPGLTPGEATGASGRRLRAFPAVAAPAAVEAGVEFTLTVSLAITAAADSPDATPILMVVRGNPGRDSDTDYLEPAWRSSRGPVRCRSWLPRRR